MLCNIWSQTTHLSHRRLCHVRRCACHSIFCSLITVIVKSPAIRIPWPFLLQHKLDDTSKRLETVGQPYSLSFRTAFRLGVANHHTPVHRPFVLRSNSWSTVPIRHSVFPHSQRPRWWAKRPRRARCRVKPPSFQWPTPMGHVNHVCVDGQQASPSQPSVTNTWQTSSSVCAMYKKIPPRPLCYFVKLIICYYVLHIVHVPFSFAFRPHHPTRYAR